MAPLPLIQKLLILQSPSSRGVALSEAGLDMFRIAIITADLEAERPVSFNLKEVEGLLAAILRQTSIDDATFAKVAAEAGIKLSRGSTDDVVVSVPFVTARGGQQLPITELAASSMVMWEISLRVREVLEALDVSEPLDPPGVTVRPGSTTFSFGGGTLLVSGIGLVIAAHAALPLGVAATIAYWGGSLVSVLGITDLIFSWRKGFAEVEKLKAETLKLEAEEQKILIEVERATSEVRKLDAESLLNAAHERLMKLDEMRANSQPKPAAALLPRQDIAFQAEAYGIWPPLATHLINRVLPIIADATRNYPERITSSRGSSGRAAGAGQS
jgi:hypothetical protein